MKLKYIFLLVLAGFAFSCAPKVRTYADAERKFLKSLTKADTLCVHKMCNEFMMDVQSGELDKAISQLCVVYNDTLFKVGDESLARIKKRFKAFPVQQFSLARYSFSTPGNNDFCYRYSVNGPLNEGDGAMKIVFNPVKVEGAWYLCLKDGSQSSLDRVAREQFDPMSPAPAPIKLNKKPKGK